MKSSLNRIFKVIWSKVQMAWVAVSEVATAHGKQQSITRITRTVTTVAMLSGGAAIAAPPAVNQLPTGGQVAAGIAAIGTNGNTMTVTQTSDRAAINWNTFDIGSQAAVNFVQPGANAVALNRVNSPNPSQIYGQLSSNGQVYLINAAGVYFAPGAQVNVGGIVATTHQMSDAAFMAGSTTFDRNGSTGKVINEGTIQTSLNGYIAMLAPEVRNSGLLLAQAGTVAMAAGESITLNFGPTSKLDSITVTAAQLDTLVENRTAIKAPNGLVILSARAANQLAASVINSGTIEAKGVSQQGGRIVLEGSTVSNTGTLDVSSDTAKAGTILINGKNVSLSGNIIATSPSQAANTQGGTVKVLATETLNVANANILASGNQGGQIQLAANQLTVTETTINADGDTQGGSVHLSATSIQQSNPFHDPLNVPTLPATLAASGFTSIGSRSRRGQGGNVTLTGDNITLDGNTHINVSGAKGGGNALIGGDWQGSNGTYQATTVYMGANTSIDASATDTGNGGKVVLWSDITNANGWTNVYGSVYARGGANGGSGGQVETSGGILQFAGFRVDTQAADGGAGQWLLDPYNFFLDSTELGTIATNLNSSNITLSTVSSSTGGANADTFGMGHLVLRSDFNYSGSNNRTLTLNANSSIWVNGNMSATGSGALGLSFNANNSVFLDGNISSKGGSVSFSAATVNFQKESGDQSINTAGGSLTFGSSNISLAQQSGGGTVTFDTGAGALTLGSGTIAQTATRYSIADPVFMMGWGGRFGSGNANYNSSVKNHTDMPLVAGNEYTVRMYLWGNPSSTAQYDVQNSTGNFAYIRVLKDTTGSVSISTASSGTQYRINDSQTVDVAFIAQSNGTLQGYTTLTSGGWDPAFELYGLTRTGLSTTTVSGTRSLTLASSTGQITGSKNASDLASLTVNTGNTTSSLSGVISGTTNLFKLGAGTLTLSGTNTYTGTTNITAGTLIVSSSLSDSTVVNVSSGAAYNVSATDTIAAFAGLGTINLGSGSTLTAFGDNRTSTFDGVIAGSGSLAKAGTGELTLTANNSWTGAANITAGNLTVNGTGKLGGGSYSGALTVASGTNFNWRSTSTQTLSSIAGAGNFTANASSGTLTISGTQTFTGTYNFAQNVTVSGGGNAASSGLGTAAAININNGGNLSLGGGDNSFLGSSNSLTSTVVTVNSGGTLYAASGSHHLGRLNLAGGTTSGAAAANYYYIDQAVNVSASSTMNTTQLKLAANASFNVSSGNTLTINGVVQDGTNTNLLLLGGGNLVLAGVNTYTGSTTINGGSTLRVNGSGSLNSGSYAGAIVNNGSFIYNSSAAQTLSGNISGNGTLTQNGSGNLTLTGANNSYSGDTIINAGNLTIGGAGRLGNGSYAGNITNNGTLIFNSSANQTLSGVISGSGNVTENAGNLTLSGSNTYSGNTTITGGVLLVSSDSNLGAAPGSATAGKILINGGSLRATANFTLNTNRGISLGASNGTFVIDPSVSLNYAGVIAGTGNMTKSGTGTLVLSGDSTYSGSTNITAGTLQVGVGGTVGSVNASSNINISSGAIFALNRTDALTIGNAISGAGGVIISQANNVNITGAATYTGNTSVGGGALSFTNANAPTTANFTGSGTILIQPSGASFGAAQTVNYNVASAFTGFTIGSETNTANLAIGSSSTLNISGPISLYAGNITLSDNLVSSGAGSKILIKALGKITTGADSLTFQTNNGSLVFWSNANSTSGGGINLENNNLTFNTANGAINQATGGGDLIFGGGAGVDANGNPTGAAISSGTAISFNPVAGGNNITKMHTGGGNIRVNANSTGGVGLYFWQATLMNSGNGSISVIGQSATSRGIEFNAGGSATNGTSITGQGITLTGTSLSGGSVPGLAIGNNSAEIVSTGSGDITITGTANGSVGLNLTANKVNITSADGNISLVGSSAGTTGINYYYGNVQSTGNGSISLNGSSTAHAGIYQHSVVNYSTTTGNISIVASGAGSPDSALTIGGSNITTTTGSVLLQGVATGSSRAVYFTGITNVTTAGGSITVNGTANTGSGIQTAYNLSMCVSQGAGAIAVTGSSTASGYGIGFQGTTTNLTTAVGDITLTGTSPGASASAIEYYGGNIVSSAGGNISINANSGRAGFYQPNVLNITATTGNISILANGGSNFHTIQMGGGNITTTTGDVRIEGNHSGAYKGVYFLTNPTNITTAGGDITINGTSSSDWATYFSSAANLFSQSGNISVSGISNSSGGFYSGASNFTATSGNITLFGNGSHASAGGYQASSSVISTTSGTVQITGIARGSYPGIYYSGTLGITTSNGGDIILNGTGGTGGQGIQFDGNVNLNASQGSGNISLTGTSTPTRGIHAIAALNIATSTGSIFLNGTSGAGYQGVRVEGASNISSTTGDITINGTASTGNGIQFDSASSTIRSTSGNIALNGVTGNGGAWGLYYLGSEISSAGNISLTSDGLMRVNANIYSYGAGNNLVIKSNGSIQNSAATQTIQTNNGTLVLWANANGSTTTGRVLFDDSVATLNTANGSTTQTSGGGDIIVGGGSVVDGDGNPIGAVSYNADWAVSFGGSSSGSGQIYSGGGDISIKGNTSSGIGVILGRNSTVNAGNGTINIEGCGTTTAVFLNTWNGGPYNITAKGDITLTGSTSGWNANVSHAYTGIRSFYDSQSQGGTIRSTGGNVTLTGTGQGEAVFIYSNNNIVADTGNVTITGTAVSGYRGIVMLGNVLAGGSNINISTTNNNKIWLSGTVGQLAGSAVATTNANITISGSQLFDGNAPTLNTQTGNITLRANTFSWTGTPTLGTNGSIAILPLSDSAGFGQGLYTSWFNLNPTINGATYTPNQLTIGNAYNTEALYWNSDNTVKGAISLYGGTVSLSANMTSSATGDIWIQGNNTGNTVIEATSNISKTGGALSNITFRANGRITLGNSLINATNNGGANVILWSDYGNSNTGGVSSAGSINTNGGHVWIGGSSTANGTLTWNGLTVGDGGSVGANGANWNAMDVAGNITTNGGDVLLWVGSAYSTGNSLNLAAAKSITAGSGNITLIAKAINSNALTVNTTGTFTWAPNSSTDWGSGATWNGTSASNIFTADANSTFANLKIANVSTLSNLVLGRYSGMTGGLGAYFINNQANLTFAGNTTISGNITAYGAAVSVGSGGVLATTASNTGNIALVSTVSSGNLGNITTNGSHVAFIGPQANFLGNITTNGGSIWAGDTSYSLLNAAGGFGYKVVNGGSSSTYYNAIANAVVYGNNRWNGQTVGSTGTVVWLGSSAIINSGSGDIMLWAKTPDNTNKAYLFGDATLRATTGNIAFIADKVEPWTNYTGNLTFSTNGTVNLASTSGNYGGTFTLGGAASGSDFVGAGTLANIKIANMFVANSSVAHPASLVIGRYTGTGLSGDTVYSFGNTGNITVNGTLQSVSASATPYTNIVLNAPNVNITGNLGSAGGVTINTAGNVTQTAGSSASLVYAFNGGNVNLSSTANALTNISAAGVGNLTIVDAYTGTADGLVLSGVNVTGKVDIQNTGSIKLASGNIRTTSTASSVASPAVRLAAGYNYAVGNTSSNVNITSGQTITMGTGALGMIYSGGVSDTDLGGLVTSGSGRFRYSSNVSSAGYNTTAAALTTGLYTLYREAPTLTVTANSSTIVYGNGSSLGMTNNALNGDTLTQILGSTPTLSASGNISTSGNWAVGNHTVTPNGSATNYLGYANVAYVNGTVEVTPATLTISGTQVSDKVYNNSTVATFTNNGSLVGVLSNGTTSVSDVVTLTAAGEFSSKNVGANIAVTMNSTISGADAGNYVLTQPSSTTANITAKTVTLSASKTYDGNTDLTGDVTIVTGIAGETLTYTNATAFSSNVADNASNYIDAITLGNQSGANATQGGLASNYQLPSLSATGANNTVTLSAKDVTLSLGGVSKVYSGNTSYTANVSDLATLSALLGVSGDTVTGISLTYDNKNVGTGKTLLASAANISSGNSNYNITYTDTSDSIITRLSSVTWTGGTTGNWFDASNWAGGAVPDLSNVETVIIPTGIAATFGSATASAVNITGLQAAAATLYQTNGTLNVGSGGIALSNLTQAAGNITTTGDIATSILSGTGGNISLGAGTTLNVTQSTSSTYAGKIAGAGSLLKAGTGSLTLTGVSTFTGGTNITAGTLIAGNSNPSSSLADTGSVNVESGATYQLGGSETIGTLTGSGSVVLGSHTLTAYNGASSGTFGGVISGSGHFAVATNASATLTGNSTYTGETVLYGNATLTLGTGGTSGNVGGSSRVSFRDGSVLRFNRSDNLDFTADLNDQGGTQSLIKDGAGILTLSSTSSGNSFDGTITVNAGTLNVTGGVLGASNTVRIQNNDATVIYNTSATQNLSVLNGTGVFQKLGSGTLQLATSSGFTGETTVSGGVLDLRNSVIGGNITNNADVWFNSWVGSPTYSKIISGTGNVTIQSNADVTFTGTNTYTGTTTNYGSLRLGAGGTTGSVAAAGGIASTGNVYFNRSDNPTYAGVISGTGHVHFVKSATLTANSTFTGETVLMDNATLTLGAGGTSGNVGGSSRVSFRDGSVLRFNRSDNLNFTADLNDQGGTQSVIKDGAGILTLSSTSSGNSFDGTITVNAGTLNVTGGVLGASNTVRIQNNDATVIYNTSATQNLSVLNGTGVFQKLGSGTLQLATSSGFTGETTVSGGVLDLRNTAIGGNITNNADVWFNSWVGSPTYSKIISGTGNVTVHSNADVTLTGTNTYTGFTANYGTLRIGANGTAGSLASSGISGSGTLIFNRSDASTYAGVISGTLGVRKYGLGTLTFTGANTYSTATNVYEGTLQIGSGSTTGSVNATSNIVLSSGATVAFNRSDDVSFANNISGSGGKLIQLGSGNLTLTGLNSYTGVTNVSAGSIVFSHNTRPSTSGFTGTGNITITPAGSAFTSAFSTGSYTYASTLGGLTIGNASSSANANITVNAALSIAGSINLYGGNIAVNSALTNAGSSIIRLAAASSGNISQGASGNITTSGLALLGGNANLTNVNNSVSTLAAQSVANLSFVNAGDLIIGSVNPTGLDTTGAVNITVQSGNISLTEAITTTSSASNAIVLNAGAGTAAGTATGGDILISGNGSVTVGSGGRATLFTGSIADSTGVTNLVGNGSGNFRYNSNASSTGYNSTAAGLGAGTYAIYREQPTLTVTANNVSSTYGTNPTMNVTSSASNGDTLAQIYGAGNEPTTSIDGNTSSTGYYVAGAHNISLSGAGATLLGYAAPTYVNGTLTVGQATLSVIGSLVADKVYDGTTTASVTNGTLSGSYSGNVTLVQAGNFSAKNVGSNLTVTFADSLTGLDAANYVLIQPSSTTANITARTVTLSAAKTYDGSTDLTGYVTIATGVSGETLTYTGATANSANVADNASNYISSITLGNQVGANSTSGGLAINYQMPALNVNNAPVTISTANLTIASNSTSTQYGLGTNVSAVGYTTTGLVNNETIGSVTLTSAGSAATSNAGSYNITASGAANGTFTASNYNISYANGTLTVTPANITVTANDQSRTYGGSNPTSGNVTLTTGNLYNGDSLGTASVASAANATSNVGNYTLTASAQTFSNGTASNYNISYVAGNLSVTQANLTITANSTSTQYGLGTTLGTTNFTAVGLQNSETIGSVTLTSAGTSNTSSVGNYSIAASGASGGNFSISNYNVTYSGGNLQVTRANLTIAANSTSRQYGLGTTLGTTNFTAVGLQNGETVGNVTLASNGSAVTANAGSYNITASGAANGTFSASNYDISYTNGTLTVTPADITVTVNDQSRTYGASNPTSGNVTLTTGALYNGDTLSTASVASSANATSNVGNYNLTASAQTFSNGAASNYNISYANGTLTVNPADAVVTANSANLTYNGSQQSVSGFTVTGLVNGETAAVLTNVTAGVNGTNAGTYTTTATGTAQNYNLSFVDGTLVIDKAALTVTGNTANVTYTGQTQSVTGYSVAGLQGADTVADLTSISASGASGINAGTYTNTVSVGTETNYVLTTVDGALNVAKANLTVTANSANVTYNGSQQSVAGFTATGLVNGETIAVLTNVSAGTSGTNAGIYTNQATGNADNYNLNFVNGTLTIDKALATVTGNSSSVTYNGQSQSVSGYSITGLQGSDTAADLVSISASGASARNAGTYSNEVTVGTETNYALTGVNGTLAIAQKAITITGIAAADKTYDGTTAAVVSNASAAGWIAGDNVTVTATGAFADKNAGTAKTVVLNSTYAGSDVGNYVITDQATATADIAKATLTAVGNKVYDGLITINGSQLSVSGVNGETFSATGMGTMSTKNVQVAQNLSSVAGLSLTGVLGSDLANYEALAIADTSATVTALAITLVAPNATKVYDGTALRNTTTSDLTALSAQLVGGDSVSAAQIVYGNKDVGAAKRVTLNSVTIDDGNSGANYQVSYTDSYTGVITKAPLTVTVVNDAKFVSQSDTAGYAGVVYSGFVSGETDSVLTPGSVSRANSGVNGAGTYSGVLQASGWNATNYDITYQAGAYTIVPANTLLVRAAAATTNYGTAPTYTLTAEYLASNGTVINALGSSLNSYVSVIDGAGGSAMFNLNPVNASFSSSNNLQVGGYNLGATNLTVGGNNFSNLVVVGSLTVNPKVLNSNLGVQTISKVYDGSTSLTGVALNFDRNVAGVLGSDVVTLSGSGSYNNRNVGANKTVSISMGLSGSDAQNYALSTTNSNVTGEITQLSSVQYIGPSNGSWSDSRNWAGGALPDGNNVAQVIIPTAMTVVYDSDLVGVTGSQIVNNGNISFTSANPFNLTNNVSGVGSIFQIGSGMLTVSGNNAGMSGNIDIGSNALTLASLNALGLGSVVSNGGRLSLTGTLARLEVDGAVTLLTRVHTTGDQRYNGPVTFLSSGTPYDLTNSTAAVPNFYSTLGNISFMSTVSAGGGSKSAQRNLVVSAANGTVLFNDQVGQDVLASRLSDVATINFSDYNRSDTSPYSVDVAAQTIKLFGDVTSFETQQYRGAMLVGDNGSNGDTRLLLSMDPLVSITGSVDDVNAGQHTLMLRAITLGNDTPRVNVYADVGQTRVLNNIDIATGRQNQASGSRVADTSGVGNDVGEKNTSGTWKSKDQWLAEVARDRYSAARSTDSRGSDQHGKRFATLANAAQQAQLASSEGAIDAGEVVVGDIINLNCDPKADESCRAK